ncbi:MAG: serine hydrolase [Thermoanaerobaculia bacterium]
MNFRRSNLFLALLLGCTATAIAQNAPVLDERVRQLVTTKVEGGGYPSIVVGVIDGERLEVVGFGSMADDRKRAPDGATVYEIGSVTKTFTALLLADAVERGEASLDLPVERLLSDTRIPSSGNRSITLLDLATQSSGLPRLPDNLLPKDVANPYADYTIADLKKFLATYHLPRAPGERYEYSNLGFGLLGQALSHKSGVPYGELVRRRITATLGMNDTSIALTPVLAARFAPGHDAQGKPARPWDLGALEGAGALRSSARDLLTYLRAHMHPPAGPLAKALAEVVRPQRATDRESAKIGLAWQIESRQGQTIVWHDGMTGGSASFVGFNADGSRGVVVLSNISRDLGDIGFAVLLPESKTSTAPKEIVLDPKMHAEYVGRYRLAPGFDLVISAVDGGLQARGTGQPAAAIFATARDELFLKMVDAQLSFRRDEKGRVASLVLHQNGHDMPAPRVANEAAVAFAAPASPKELKLEAAALVPYVGRYALAPGFALHVTAEKDQLYVQATAQARIPVYASAPDDFFYKVVDARLSFERGKDGSVPALVLHQNGRDLRGARQAE